MIVAINVVGVVYVYDDVQKEYALFSFSFGTRGRRRVRLRLKNKQGYKCAYIYNVKSKQGVKKMSWFLLA